MCLLLWTFSCSLLALLASTVHWLCCYLFLNAANHRLRSVLDSTKHVHCGGLAALSYPSSIVKKRHSSLSRPCPLSFKARHISASGISSWVSARDTWGHLRERKLTFLSVTDTYVHTYVHCENRSLIQSLALMCSATRYMIMCLMLSMRSRVSRWGESLDQVLSPAVFHPVVEQLTIFYISRLIL